MLMPRTFSIVPTILAIALGAACAEATPPSGWQPVANNDVGDVYAGPNGAIMRTATRAELQEGCSCTLDIGANGWGEDALLQALSVMWIDVADHQITGSGAEAAMRGNGMTENGEVAFALAASGDQLKVLLAPSERGLSQAKALLAADWTAGSQRAASAQTAARPAQQETRRTAAAGGKTRVAPGQYQPPPSLNLSKVWTKTGQWWLVQKPGDATSPRFAVGQTGPKFDVRSHDRAIGAIEEYFKVQFTARPKLEKLESWQKLDGSDFRIAFAPTNLGGAEGVAFIMIKQPRGRDVYQMNVLEMPRQSFVEWGGAARMMVLRGLMPSMEVFPKSERDRIARGSMASQTAFYEAAADKYFQMQAARTMAMTQTNLLLGMQELNYDLLFGNDIGTSVVDY